MEYLKLRPNAGDLVRQELASSTTKQLYDGLQDNIYKKNKSLFCVAMQSYIVRLGILLMKCYGKTTSHNYYNYCLKFICYLVINKPQLYALFETFKINQKGNGVKHSLDDVNVYFEEVVLIYNQIIESLVYSTNIQDFKMCALKAKRPTRNVRDTPVFQEKRDVKHDSCAGIDYEIKMKDTYSIDIYKKKIITSINIFFRNPIKNRSVRVKVINNKNGKVIANYDKKDLMSFANVSRDISVSCSEDDLTRRVLDVTVEVSIYKETINHTWGDVFKLLDTAQSKLLSTTKTAVSQMLYPEKQI